MANRISALELMEILRRCRCGGEGFVDGEDAADQRGEYRVVRIDGLFSMETVAEMVNGRIDGSWPRIDGKHGCTDWLTGRPHDAEPFAKVEVEYRDGSREAGEVVEIDWNRPDEGDKYSPLPEREVVRYRFIPT
jgi:hypothetical protein